MAPPAARTLVLLGFLTGAAPSFAGSFTSLNLTYAAPEPATLLLPKKLDLSPYLGNPREQGDVKTYSLSDGGERIVTVLEAGPWAKGWRELVESEVTGPDAGTAIFEDFLIPGRQLLAGSEFYDNGVSFIVKKPAKGLRLLVTPGKPQRTKSKAALVLDGAAVGSAERASVWLAEGFESVSTPSGDYANALRARSFSGLRLDDGFDEVVYFWNSTVWYAEVRGVVQREVFFESYVNGSLDEEDSWVEELVSGELGGVPFP